MEPVDLFDPESVQHHDLLETQTLPPSTALLKTTEDGEDEENQQHPLSPCLSFDQQQNHLALRLTGVQEQNAKKHFEQTMAKCRCTPRCVFNNAWETSLGFAAMSELERINSVRSILLALTASNDQSNFLNRWDTQYAHARKRKRRLLSEEGHTTTMYAMRGKRVCMNAFAAVVQLHPRTINDYACQVSSASSFAWHTNNRTNSRKGKLTTQTKVAISFLDRYGYLNAMSCPTGRGSESELPVRWLPSDTRRETVYESYKYSWNALIEGFVVHAAVQKPSAPLSRVAFCAIWRSHCPTLKIIRRGSDFCDTCTQLLNSASILTDINAKQAVLTARKQHREEDKIEYEHYCTLQSSSKTNPRSAPLHLIFDFSEKVLLAHLLRQPGQLHFVTGLQFDIIGVYSSNMNKCFIFGLPEGHWQNNKTANEVASMLQFVLEQHRSAPHNLGQRHACFTADNCSGQNKNRFMIWFFAWRVIMEYEDCIELFFLVAGTPRIDMTGHLA